jgi:hypothetical protein
MQFLPRCRSRKPPCNRGVSRIARVFIRGDLTDEHRFVRYTAVQTLALQDTQCNCGPIQPTAVLGRIMQCELLHNTACFCGGKGFIERRGFVGVEVVQHNTNPLRLWIPFIDQPWHVLGTVLHRPLLGDRNMPPAGLRCTEHQRRVGTVDPFGYGVSPPPNRACTFPCTRLSILEFLPSVGEFMGVKEVVTFIAEDHGFPLAVAHHLLPPFFTL